MTDRETDRSEAVAALAEVMHHDPGCPQLDYWRDKAGALLDGLRDNPDLAARVARALRPEREEAGLREAMLSALDELGVPGEGYPAPVANAVAILRAALGAVPPQSET